MPRRISQTVGMSRATALLIVLLVGLLSVGAFASEQVWRHSAAHAQDPGSSSGSSTVDPGSPPTASLHSLDPPVLADLVLQGNGIALEWTAPETSMTISGYSIRRAPSTNDADFVVIVADTDSADTEYLDKMSGVQRHDLDSGSTWAYQIRVLVSDDHGASHESDWSDLQSIELPVFPRPASIGFEVLYVRNIPARKVTWSAPTLSWSNVPDVPVALSGYEVYKATYHIGSRAIGTVHRIAQADADARSVVNVIGRPVQWHKWWVYAKYGIWYSRSVSDVR